MAGRRCSRDIACWDQSAKAKCLTAVAPAIQAVAVALIQAVAVALIQAGEGALIQAAAVLRVREELRLLATGPRHRNRLRTRSIPELKRTRQRLQ